MTENRWLSRFGYGLILSALLIVPFTSTPSTAFALDLNPFDYYEFDYHIVFSDDEVEPGEEFSVTVGAEVRCIKDMPFGADEAALVVSGVARHAASGEEIALLDDFEVAVPDVPDWQGDTFVTEESVDLAFPADAASGAYDIVARLEYVSIDGWNITGLVPSGYRSISIGPISVTSPDPAPPAPQVTPGHLSISILGHEYSPEINDEGLVLQDVTARLIEGEVTLALQEGTCCLDASGDPLGHISVVRSSSPAPFAEGLVLAAYSLHPGGAVFSPGISMGVTYEESGFPPGITEHDLTLAFHDNGAWKTISSTVDTAATTVRADIRHFSTIGLLALTNAPSPAAFSVSDLSVSPTTVPPMAGVNVSFAVRNTGGAAGTYPLMVEVNGRSEYARELTIGPSSSQHIRFRLARATPGTYTVSVNDELTASFIVQSTISAAETTGAQENSAAPGAPQESAQPTQDGLHPVFIALLVMAGVAFLTIVILLLAGVL